MHSSRSIAAAAGKALALGLLLCAPAAFAADGIAGGLPARVLELRTGTVQTSGLPNLLTARAAFAAGARYVIQLDGPMTEARRLALEAAGVTPGQYLPQNSYVVDLSKTDAGRIAVLGFVSWVGDYQQAWKLDPELGRRAYQSADRQGLAAAGQCQLVIVTHDGQDSVPAVNEVLRLGGNVLNATPCGDAWMIDATIAVAQANALAALPGIAFIEDAPEGEFRNDSNRWILQSNQSGQTPVWNRGLHGEGQIGGLIDGTIRESHCMFDDAVPVGPTHRKIVAMRNSGGIDSHGTHTAGTMAGDNAPYGTYTSNDGLAFAAKISFSNASTIWGNPSTLNARLVDAHNDGARVHSNSWGDDGTTAYTTWCRQIDQFTWDNEDDVVAFATTNLSTLKTPENSVNVLAVGASQDSPSQGNHCSGGTGPTSDGRRKPETYAPGCNTTSASSSSTCGTTGLTGTSMACPAASGAAILVRQYFADGFYPTGGAVSGNGFSPSGALVRAAVISSSVDMSGVAGYPSTREGWGRILLDDSLFFTGDARKLFVADLRNPSGLTTGQTAVHSFTVNSSGQPLRVTMVFTGPPAAVNAANPVINNLDLEVVAPGNTLYRGNVFVSGQSTTGGSPDAKNNAEMVLISAPSSGQYTVTIRGAAVNQARQGYALVVTGDVSTCNAADVTGQPASQTVRTEDDVTFTVSPGGTPPFTYQWFKDGDPVDNAVAASFDIFGVELADAGDYTCTVTNGCGSDTSSAATLTVFCRSDFDQDGFVTGVDFDLFRVAFEAGLETADHDGNGFVNGEDFDQFVQDFETGC